MAYASIFQALGTYNASTGAGSVSTVSLASNQTSAVFAPAGESFNFSFQFAVTSGTPTGTFVVDVSNDPRANDAIYGSSAVWTTAQSVSFTSGAAPDSTSNCMIVVQNGARYARCRWIAGSGSGQGQAFGYGVSV